MPPSILRPGGDLAACDAVLDLEKGRGVLQAFEGLASSPSMSLGTRRLCNDPAAGLKPEDLPVACIEWNRITFYREAPVKPHKPKDRAPSLANLTRGTFNGYMSPATRRTFRRIASTWLRSMQIYRAEVKRKWDPGRAYPTMVTLTLPAKQTHTDREIYRACLMPWLQLCRREFGVEHYVWRAEAQENGNLHYHLILDRYIPKTGVQLSWNQCINALGYRDRYFEATGSLYPPSTEVHGLKDKVQDKKTGEWRDVDPIEYMLDYFSDTPELQEEEPGEKTDPPKPRVLIGHYRDKNGNRQQYTSRPITGRVWGMADALRPIREPKARASLAMITSLDEATDRRELRKVETEHATMYFGKVSLVLGRSAPAAWATVKEYYLQVFGHLYPAQLPEEYVRAHPPMDPVGLWVDLDAAAFYYPPSYEERLDAWYAINEPDERLMVSGTFRQSVLVPRPEHGYKAARIARKLHRINKSKHP